MGSVPVAALAQKLTELRLLLRVFGGGGHFKKNYSCSPACQIKNSRVLSGRAPLNQKNIFDSVVSEREVDTVTPAEVLGEESRKNGTPATRT